MFFLVISWAQLMWPVILLWRPARLWLWLGIAGNAIVIAVYVASRTVGLPFGPDLHNAESVGALDVVSCVLEFGLIVGCAALLWRPSLADRPVARRGAFARAAALIAVPVAVIAATTAVMTPGWAGPEGPAGMASGMSSQSSSSTSDSSSALNSGMGDMGSTDGQPDMQMYGSTAPPTAAQVVAAAQLIKETDTSLKRYANVQAAFAAGYTYVLKTNGEEHLLYNGGNPAYQGLNPQDPSSLVYAINVPNHAPILLGAMYIMGGQQQNGPQIGGGLTRWHSHLVLCINGRQTIAGFAGGNDPGDQSEERPDAGRGDHLGEEHACPLWGGEVGEGGRGVAELAVGDDRSEHGGEEHGEAGNGGHGAQPIGRGDRWDAAVGCAGHVVLKEREQSAERGSYGEQPVGEAHRGELEQFGADESGHRVTSFARGLR